MNKILKVKNLHTSFFTDEGVIPALDGVSFEIHAGEIVGIVGESGCGKSVTSLSIMGLVPSPPGKVVDGEILLNGEDLTKAPEKRMREIRGKDIAMIFQDPISSLNPVFTIGNQLIEAIRLHKNMNRRNAKQRAIEILMHVGLPRAEELLNEYPHELSGGMRQRVMIAMAMACEPMLLIADEPTTALDVTIQAQILNLMKSLNKDFQTSIMLITHDLGVVAQVCERVIVMYSGKIVEEGDVKAIFQDPKHPYTKGLIKSVPSVHKKKEKLYSIPGNVPKPGSIKQGCRFSARCEYAMEQCFTDNPELQIIEKSHRASCFLYQKELKQGSAL